MVWNLVKLDTPEGTELILRENIPGGYEGLSEDSELEDGTALVKGKHWRLLNRRGKFIAWVEASPEMLDAILLGE